MSYIRVCMQHMRLHKNQWLQWYHHVILRERWRKTREEVDEKWAPILGAIAFWHTQQEAKTLTWSSISLHLVLLRRYVVQVMWDLGCKKIYDLFCGPNNEERQHKYSVSNMIKVSHPALREWMGILWCQKSQKNSDHPNINPANPNSMTSVDPEKLCPFTYQFL